MSREYHLIEARNLHGSYERADDVLLHGQIWHCCDGSPFLFSLERFEKLQQWAGYVREDLETLRTDFIRLGFHLYEMQRDFLHVGDFYEFVERQFCLCRSTVTKLLAVFRAFSDDCSMFLLKRWGEYSYSQLEAALPLIKHWDLLNKLRPDMTVAQIKALAASLKPSSKLADIRENVISGTSSRVHTASDFFFFSRDDLITFGVHCMNGMAVSEAYTLVFDACVRSKVAV